MRWLILPLLTLPLAHHQEYRFMPGLEGGSHILADLTEAAAAR